MVVTVGLTIILLPVSAPGLHVYDVAPLAVRFELWPRQMEDSDALATTVGTGLAT
jgi:hypothetical protein